MKSIVRTSLMLLAISAGYGVANADTGIIILNRDIPTPKIENPCTALPKIDVTTVIANATGIIITNLTGILITNVADNGGVNCGVIISN